MPIRFHDGLKRFSYLIYACPLPSPSQSILLVPPPLSHLRRSSRALQESCIDAVTKLRGTLYVHQGSSILSHARPLRKTRHRLSVLRLRPCTF